MEDEERLLGKSSEVDKKSLYHGGFQLLERIDNVLRALDVVTMPTERGKCLSFSQYSQWFALEKTLFKEMFPKLNDEERKENLEAMHKLSKNLDEMQDIVNRGKTKVPKQTLDEFYYWELQLRDLVGKKGLLMPSKLDGLDATEK